MAIFHLSCKVISRGNGKSAVAAAAYRSGEKITNEYDGETHDYTKKGGIFSTAILLPPNAPKEYADRSTLWNAVEKIEKSKNAQLAREVEVAIPKELQKGQWAILMREYCKTNFVDKGMIADFSIHNKDDNNPHCHILLTMRPIKENGEWGAKSRKVYDLDENGQRIKLSSGNWKSHKEDTTDWNDQSNAELWRANWSEHCNRYLEKIGYSERIDHRSYERQGVSLIPQIHLGVSASQMEQKGIATDRGNANRQILNDNKLIIQTRARISRLMKWQRELKAQPLDLKQAGIKTSIIDTLQANKTASTSRYQKTKDLKNYVSVWNFLQKHNVDNIEDFASKIVDMNESFYALKREANITQKAIDDREKQITLWTEYDRLKPLFKRYQKLQGETKQQFYATHCAELDRANELNKYWGDYVSSGGKISPKQWADDIRKLKNDVLLCEWKMNALKDEIGSAERIRKALDEIVESEKNSRRVAEQGREK